MHVCVQIGLTIIQVRDPPLACGIVSLGNPYHKDNIEAEQNSNFYAFSLLGQPPFHHGELQTFHL